MLRFDKATYSSLFFQFILSETLTISVWGSVVLLSFFFFFFEFINMVSIFVYSYICIEFIIKLDTFLVISFVRYKEYI